jgi:uracil phosphoribosyltransferase
MTLAAVRGVTVLDHPLIRHKLALLRDARTSSRDFKQLVGEIAALMTYEVTRDLPTETVEVTTPLETTQGEQVAVRLALVPILRAGLGMVEGIHQLIPTARVGHIGLYRDHDTLKPISYYFKVPTPVADHRFLILDPMLATGGSAIAATTRLKEAGARDLALLCLVAAPEGAAAFTTAHPDVPVYVAAMDRQLNEHGYILPGLGDAGDRIFGTR